MTLDTLSGTFAIATRDQVRDRYLVALKLRIPEANVGEGTQCFVDASTCADLVAPIYNDAKLCADATSRKTSTGTKLNEDGAALNVPRQGEGQSTGYVSIVTADGGASILAGTELRYPAKQQKFKTLITGVYTSSTPLAIQAVAAGVGGNLAAGTKLKFTNPPVGVSEIATVFQNADGSGLNGGIEAEDDDAYRKRQDAYIAEPPSAGNEAAVLLAMEEIRGIAIQRAFCYPAILGPATMGVAFTMRPSKPGASRLPSPTHVALVEAYLRDKFPGDDGIMVASGLDDDTLLLVQLRWKTNAPGWLDTTPWPIFYSDPPHVVDTPSPTVSSCRLTSGDVIVPPTVGKSIGFFDPVTSTFARKRIATVTQISANHTYDVTFDMATPGASDVAFVPIVDTVCSPWSDSLDATAEPLLTYIDNQGPGEMVATFPDAGRRQRRFPAPEPTEWPHEIENRIVDGLFDVVGDATLAFPTTPHPTQIGTPGLLFYLHRATDIGLYPE